MKKIKVELQNCYGIRSLEHEFDFSNPKERVYAIYAPNGSMKTSFAKVMMDLSNGDDSRDEIYGEERKTIRKILDQSGEEIKPEEVLVIESYAEEYKSKKVSTLLVDKKLKKQYEDIYKDIQEKKQTLLGLLKKTSKLKNNNDVEQKVIKAVLSIEHPTIGSYDSKDFFTALNRIKKEIFDKEYDDGMEEIKYSVIFNEKVLPKLEEAKVKQNMEEYIKQYANLIKTSNFFQRGFNHYNAETIAKNLEKNGYFKANHTINIKIQGEKVEISTMEELTEAIEREKNIILKDENLRQAFTALDNDFWDNQELRSFIDFLEQNPHWIEKIINIRHFEVNLWIAYLAQYADVFGDLLKTYDEGKEKLEKIATKAEEQRTDWTKIIDIFNKRFLVPFEVKIGNKTDAIIKGDVPVIEFIFKDGENEEAKPTSEDQLLEILSGGEKRALYLLNVIFEIEARKKEKQETLFIIDDIADSFDYKNKYAIIAYLNDISKEAYFYQIILSHNFDFYRTVCSRIGMDREKKCHALKLEDSVKLVTEKYQNSPFSTWKKNLNDEVMLVASIPFFRNIAEYCEHEDEFKKLTSLLHYKSDTDEIKVSDLQNIINKILNDKASCELKNQDTPVKEIIEKIPDKISARRTSGVEEHVTLEDKVALAIAIRLKAEYFLAQEINNHEFTEKIEKNQTYELISKYKDMLKENQIDNPLIDSNLRTLDEVNLMTPENIHLNSFMYEPILDMSMHHLEKLHRDACALKNILRTEN